MPQETVEERAKRLGLTQETVEQRAQRLGIATPPSGHAGKAFVDAPEIVNRRTADNASPAELTQHNGKPFVNAVGDAPDTGDKVLGVVAALNREIPGAEAAQAGIRSLVRGGSYQDARNDIRTAEDAAPAWATAPARAAGGAISALAIPGGPMLQAARHGLLSGLAQSDPDAGIKQRLDDAAIQGGTEAGMAGVIKGLSSQAGRDIAGAVMHPKLTLVRGLKGAGRMFGEAAREGAGTAAAPIEAVAAPEGPRSLMSLVRDGAPVEAENPGSLAPTRSATRARMNADAERMGLPVGPPPPQGAIRVPDPTDDGGSLAELLKRSIEANKLGTPLNRIGRP